MGPTYKVSNWKPSPMGIDGTIANELKAATLGQQTPVCMMHADRILPKVRDPPTPGGYWPVLKSQCHATGELVTGATTNIHRSEKKQRRRNLQEEQKPESYWQTHEGNVDIPQYMPPPIQYRNKMCPSRMVLHHPAYAKLLEYSTKGCLVKTGRNWLKEEICAAVMRAPHESALSKEDIANLVAAAKLKMDTKQSRLVWYHLINYKLPEHMKVLSIAEITHKYKAFRSIIDLAFSLWLIPQG